MIFITKYLQKNKKITSQRQKIIALFFWASWYVGALDPVKAKLGFESHLGPRSSFFSPFYFCYSSILKIHTTCFLRFFFCFLPGEKNRHYWLVFCFLRFSDISDPPCLFKRPRDRVAVASISKPTLFSFLFLVLFSFFFVCGYWTELFFLFSL